jgi:phenylalanyl-tRNA synthetase beta chain
MTGNYIENSFSNNNIKVDFYTIKGILENILDYLGLKNRYSYTLSTQESLHPGISADILLDRKKIGYIGKVHPSIRKDDIYIFELSLESLNVPVKPLKFKPYSKLPSIKKDLAFIVDKSVMAEEIEKIIKHAGSRLLTNIEVFDVYTGENVEEGKKSVAFNLTFEDSNKTLTDEEVTEVFNKIINEVETKLNAKLRNM